MAQIISTKFQLRRGYSTSWEKNNPVLLNGEPGFVIDLNKIKIGDGKTPWRELKFLDCSDLIIGTDNASLKIGGNNVYMIFGFDQAEENQIPIKNANGSLTWINLSQVSFTGKIEDLKQDTEFILVGGKAPIDLEEE